MHIRRVFSFTVLGLVLVTAVLSEGCRRGPYLWVRHARYQPSLPSYMVQSYRGRSIHLMKFVNRTPSRWYYYSPDRSITYEASPYLHVYLKACFAKGLTSAGVRVLPRAALNVHSLRVILHRMSDQQMVFDAYLYLNRRPVFRKRFVVRRGPVRSYDKRHLEQMAYYQVNLAIAKVFMDQQVWQAFFGVSRAPHPGTPGAPGSTPSPRPTPSPGPTPTPSPLPAPAPGSPPAPGRPPAPAPVPGGP